MKTCPHCGNTMPDFIKVCTKCGKEIQTEEKYNNNPDTKTPDSNTIKHYNEQITAPTEVHTPQNNPIPQQNDHTPNYENNTEENIEQQTYKIHIAIGIIIVIILLVLAISFTQESGEVTLFDSKISEIIYHEQNISYTLENSQLENLDISNAEDVKKMKTILENATSELSQDIETLDELNKSISDPSRKEYVGLHKQLIQDSIDMYVKIDEVLNQTTDYHNGNLTQNQLNSAYENLYYEIDDSRKQLKQDSDNIQLFLQEHPDLRVQT